MSDYLPAVIHGQPETVRTAWDACGDWWWLDTFMVRIKGGRVLYETATATPNQQTVRLFRAVGLKVINRYVDPDTPIELVPRTIDDLLPSTEERETE